MMFCIVLLAIAVYLAIPVFTGKGKLLTTENIKKDKIDAYVKYMRPPTPGVYSNSCQWRQ